MSAVSYRLDERVGLVDLGDGSTGNPIDLEFVSTLLEAVRRARADDVHVLVLRSSGAVFSVGGDLQAFAAAPDPALLIDDLADGIHRVISELQRLDAIVVAAVRGVAAGAGLALAAACDVVIAADTARFTLAYTQVGLSPDGGSSLLPATLGLHAAMYLALLNPVLSATQAQQMGLVAEVHADEEFDDAVEAVVRRLGAGSRAAQVAAKRLMRATATPAPETAMRRETEAIRDRAGSADGREGVRAFLDKRRPRFA